MLRIYLSGAISGRTYEEATEWRRVAAKELNGTGMECYDPMRGSELFSHQKSQVIASMHYPKRHPELSDKALKDRDILDIIRSDIVLVNLLHAKAVSIGTVYEVGIASYLKKLVVLVMEADNIHDHPFLRDSGVIFRTLSSALRYVKSCADGVFVEESEA